MLIQSFCYVSFQAVWEYNIDFPSDSPIDGDVIVWAASRDLKALALNACTSLVSVEPKLTIETRNHNALNRFAPLMEIEGLLPLFSSHSINSDDRSDYEDFLRDFTKQFLQHLLSRVDTYMVLTIQAFDAPWPTIQANAIYVSSSILSVSDDRHILYLYHSQVFGMLVSKMSRSTDAVVSH
ncbi:protein SHOOT GRAVITROPISM 6-like [Hibiscus syriacus]|uniref:protein SHOOT GRAVITROPISM 6-like n=1 Tax=Hibiscus syriacus TaxID=106335 RepID=UPI001921EB66|nr:protein SHOOT GRAVITROPISM 6-like [Hibiscus syriacus]